MRASTSPHRAYGLRTLTQRRLGQHTWRKAVQRLTPLEPSPERNLVCAVIAQVIVDAEAADDLPLQVLPPWLFSPGCRYYCRMLGIEHDALIEAVEAAGAAYAEVADAREAAVLSRARLHRRSVNAD